MIRMQKVSEHITLGDDGNMYFTEDGKLTLLSEGSFTVTWRNDTAWRKEDVKDKKSFCVMTNRNGRTSHFFVSSSDVTMKYEEVLQVKLMERGVWLNTWFEPKLVVEQYFAEVAGSGS